MLGHSLRVQGIIRRIPLEKRISVKVINCKHIPRRHNSSPFIHFPTKEHFLNFPQTVLLCLLQHKISTQPDYRSLCKVNNVQNMQCRFWPPCTRLARVCVRLSQCAVIRACTSDVNVRDPSRSEEHFLNVGNVLLKRTGNLFWLNLNSLWKEYSKFTSKSVVISTLLDPDRNSLIITSRSFWSMSPCWKDQSWGSVENLEIWTARLGDKMM